MLQKGDLAPGFDLPADGGKRLDLETLRGRWVVLYFYPRDDTEGCTLEAREFSVLAGKFSQAGADVIGISPDGARRHDTFKAKHELTVSLASDKDAETARAYGVWVEKTMYGRKFMGVERATFLISPDGRIQRIWRKVSPAGHAEEVLAAVGAAQA